MEELKYVVRQNSTEKKRKINFTLRMKLLIYTLLEHFKLIIDFTTILPLVPEHGFDFQFRADTELRN